MNKIRILSEDEQRNAAHFYGQITPRSISKIEPSYTYFIVILENHRAVVEIVITPSTHPQLEKQMIYSIYYRYALCCPLISRNATHEKIRRIVSEVVGAEYLLFGWDFSDESCYTFDNSQFSNIPCGSIANKLLKKYIATPSRRNEKKRKRPRTEQHDEPGTRKDKVEQKIAGALAKAIQNGLSKLALKPPDSCSISLHSNEEASYVDYAARLILLAEQQSETQIALSWCMRFLAGCISLASPSLPVLPAETSSVERNGDIVRRQRSIARVVNLIVTGLWGRWHDNAFLVYHAFAVLDYKFKNIRELGYDRYPNIAQMTVELLQKAGAPTLKFEGGQFDPSQLLCQLLKFESYQWMCGALELPSLPNYARPPISMPLIDALSNRLRSNFQPRLLCLTEQAVGPQSPLIGNNLDMADTPARSSTGGDSHAQETISCQATLSSVGYDTPTLPHLTERVVSPPAPPSFAEHAVNTHVISSTGSDSQVQEIQAINSQATPSTAGYDTQSGVERQASGSQMREPQSIGNSPLHDGQTSRLQTPDANSIDALLENDLFSLDVTGMVPKRYGNWDPFVIDIVPILNQTSRDLIS
ncbi:MAG: hypothetical protein M1840_007206 [Geoglossum simile]|nr:MAG: hypothetical protein M1840_007206 [Geoglossum simile]